jgi:hypothetical protein
MITRTLSIVLLATAISLVACDKKDEPVKTVPMAKKDAPSTAPTKSPAPTEVAAKQPEVAPTTAVAEPAPPELEPLALDNERVVAIAAAARELEDEPEDAEAVLERHGLDRETFEASITEIAKDAWKSDLYIAALGQAAKG